MSLEDRLKLSDDEFLKDLHKFSKHPIDTPHCTLEYNF